MYLEKAQVLQWYGCRTRLIDVCYPVYFYISARCKNYSPPLMDLDDSQAHSNISKHKLDEKSSLYHMITGIMGANNPTMETNLSETSVSDANVMGNLTAEVHCPGGLHDDAVGVGDPVASASELQDISQIVSKIVDIIRKPGITALQIEESLKGCGFLYNPEIVNNVLKRCFKAGHSAVRFFNWVKLQPGFRHTTETFNTLLYIAGEAKGFALVTDLIQEMQANSCGMDIKTWTILLSHYGKAKKIAEALQLFDNMRNAGVEPDEIAYKSIICSLCDAGKADLAVEFYKEMLTNNMRVDMRVYKLMLKCLSYAGDIQAVRLIGHNMTVISQIPENEVYSRILWAYCVSGRIEAALLLVREIKQKKIDLEPADFEVLVKGLCKNKQVSDALELVTIIKPDGSVSRKLCDHLIHGYLREGNTSRALELLSGVEELDCLTLVCAYTELIQHLFRSNNYEQACDLFKNMADCGIEPDMVSIMTLVAGHVHYNHIYEAWEVFDSMKKKGIKPTWKAYSVFANELCKACKSDEAFKLLNEMFSQNINPGAKLCHKVLSMLEKNNDVEKVAQVNKIMSAFQLHLGRANMPDTEPTCVTSCTHKPAVAEMPNCLVKQGCFSNEMQLGYNHLDLQELHKILSSSEGWPSMQEALEKSSIHFTSELVLAFLRGCRKYSHFGLHFFKWLEKQHGYSHTADTYNMAIKIAGSAKDFKHMRNLFDEMRKKQNLVTQNTWTIMITQYARAGLTTVALKKFEDMKHDGNKPDRSTYKFLIIFICGKKGRKVDEAAKIFEEMINECYLPDKELLDVYLNCLCDVGKLSTARKSVESLCDIGFSVQIGYSLLIKSFCRSGRVREAMVFTNKSVALGYKVDMYVYGSLIHGLLRQRKVDEAIQMVEEMRAAGVLVTVHVFTSLIIQFLKENKLREALKMFEEMKKAGLEPTIVTYSALIRGYLKEGLVSNAWNVLEKMEADGPSPDFRTFSMSINILCKMGLSEEGLGLLHKMLKGGIIPSSINFKNVFYGLNREGKRGLARIVLQMKWALARNRKFLR